jgi:hypothetical protein
MLSVPSPNAFKIASSFSTMRTVMGSVSTGTPVCKHKTSDFFVKISPSKKLLIHN